MDKLRALQYFVAAAEEGSLSAAGRRLGVTVPAVQKLVNSLEASLGVRLFERNAQGLQLTAGGEQYLEACRPLLLELEAVDEVSRAANAVWPVPWSSAPTRRLRSTCCCRPCPIGMRATPICR
jgi:DNA-binding transcriptional LysR family regulator